MIEAHSVKQKIMHYAFNERNYMAAVTEGLNNADVLGIDKNRRAIEFEIKVSRADLQKELAAIRYATMTVTERKSLAPADESQPEQLALNNELATLKKKSGGWSKISKHEEYVNPARYLADHKGYLFTRHRYVPNVFYLVVPDKLVQLAIDGTIGTGYGVIAYDGCRAAHHGYKVVDQWFTREEVDSLRPAGARWQSGRPCEIDPSQCYKEVAVKRKAKRIHNDPVDDSVIDSMLKRAVRENINMLDRLIGTDAALEKAWAELRLLKGNGDTTLLGSR